MIDVCGDGTNNAGREVTEARDDALKAGITINGLAIINDHPVSWTFAHVQPPGGLPNYYRENVTGGPGSFVLEVHDFHSFGEAMTRKLVTEIAGRCGAVGSLPRCADPAPRRAGRHDEPGYRRIGNKTRDTMGLLIDGVWHEQDPDAAKARRSRRPLRARGDRVPQLGDAGRPPRPDRA